VPGAGENKSLAYILAERTVIAGAEWVERIAYAVDIVEQFAEHTSPGLCFCPGVVRNQIQPIVYKISVSAMKALRMWEWPGNIRELENFIERAVILTRGRSLEVPLAELRKVNDEGQYLLDDRDTVARIVKETIKALHASSGVDKDSMKKQRDAIMRLSITHKSELTLRRE
jgi:hypothetical protein